MSGFRVSVLRVCAFYVAVAAIAAGAIIILAGDHAQAAWCPGWMEQYCVVKKGGFPFTAWTKPCFAKEEGMHILYRGVCRGVY